MIDSTVRRPFPCVESGQVGSNRIDWSCEGKGGREEGDSRVANAFNSFYWLIQLAGGAPRWLAGWLSQFLICWDHVINLALAKFLRTFSTQTSQGGRVSGALAQRVPSVRPSVLDREPSTSRFSSGGKGSLCDGVAGLGWSASETEQSHNPEPPDSGQASSSTDFDQLRTARSVTLGPGQTAVKLLEVERDGDASSNCRSAGEPPTCQSTNRI